MPYRKNTEHRPPRQNRTVEKLTTPGLLLIQNGSITDFAFPCWYQEAHPPIRAHLHCKDWHDHVGEPSPHHPDDSCQPYDEFAAWWTEAHEIDRRYPDYHNSPYHLRHAHRRLIDMRGLVPIHLGAEGYNKVYVSIKDKPSGLTAEGSIDPYHDHVIRVRFSAAIEEAEDEYKDYRFTVAVGGKFQESPKSGQKAMRDIAVRGILRVMPNILDSYEEV